jgi:hypothetical protein
MMTAWWYTYPSEKYENPSVGIMTFPIYMEKCSKPPTSDKYISKGNVT